MTVPIINMNQLSGNLLYTLTISRKVSITRKTVVRPVAISDYFIERDELFPKPIVQVPEIPENRMGGV